MGFALEFYDPVGRKRPEYRHVYFETKVVERSGRPQRTQLLKIKKASIESAMQLPNGREVRDLPTLKAALMADKERILKGIIGKLISYAHGREVTRADRPYIDAVFEATANQNFSLRSAIHAIVAHPEFGRK